MYWLLRMAQSGTTRRTVCLRVTAGFRCGSYGRSYDPQTELESFRFRHPIFVSAQLAVFAREHLGGGLVSLQLPPRPTRSDVSPLAAAGMINGRRMAGTFPRAVERGQILDCIECGL